jgi:hypothetical protein
LNFDSYEDLSNPWNEFQVHYTTRFNHNPHNIASNNECIGILCPFYLSGTDNYIGLRVLLCHTTRPTIGFYSILPENYLSEHQNINEEIIEEIKILYINKYGTPNMIDSAYSYINVLKDGKFKLYHDMERKGTMYVWLNKYLTVKLFTGLKSYDCKYDLENKGYSCITYLDPSNPMKVIIPKSGEMQCLSYPFIEYKLTDTAIKELNINYIKI